MPVLLLRFLPYIGGLLAIVGVLATVRHAGVVAEQNKQTKAAIKGVKVHDEIEKKVMGLRDSELDKRLSKWMRD